MAAALSGTKRGLQLASASSQSKSPTPARPMKRCHSDTARRKARAENQATADADRFPCLRDGWQPRTLGDKPAPHARCTPHCRARLVIAKTEEELGALVDGVELLVVGVFLGGHLQDGRPLLTPLSPLVEHRAHLVRNVLVDEQNRHARVVNVVVEGGLDLGRRGLAGHDEEVAVALLVDVAAARKEHAGDSVVITNDGDETIGHA
eukprot:CAMPEP_0185160802 /NCGR_PEP_ID=MMETSP1139-20130426/4017_1 /TAXON_ID=298111 /ORGANISM="Pavlova sp., Strain CCMP459" /LENGTH=205 /DNA_ID=CAMNT_0027726021 /DNA_START=84 /DNA_END=698 /DNA_ORIENTATION=+